MNNSELILNESSPQQFHGFHCPKDALTDFVGWFLQGFLAILAFTCLIGIN